MAEFITPEECEAHAAQFERPLMPRAWMRAAATIRDLREQLAAAKLTAEISAGMLETLQAETADLIEVERCKQSIEAAGCAWQHTTSVIGTHPISLLPFGPTDHLFLSRVAGKRGQDATPVDWQFAEQQAWTYASAPYRKRVDAKGCAIDLYFGRDWHPVVVTTGMCGEQGFGEPGDTLTRELLETAAQWAEAHPASEPQEPEEPEPPAKPHPNWPERCKEPGHCCQRCAHNRSNGPPCNETDCSGPGRCCHAFDSWDGKGPNYPQGDGLHCYFTPRGGAS